MDQSAESAVPPADGGVHLEATASDRARVYQAARDQHLHFHDGTRESRRARDGDDSVCPYPGLAAFGPDQSQWFFGRDQLTAELTERVDEQTRRGGLIAVVVAPSGAGKSSALRAGLLPALARGAVPAAGSRDWPQIVMTPTAHPLAALTERVAALDEDHERVIIVVDQFEELFTLCADEDERRAFITRLARLSDDEALVLIGLRADFYAPCANYPELRRALQHNQVLVGPMSEAELREAILFPAQAVGLELEPGLIELLLRDLGTTGQAGRYEAGRLPFLAHALRATWQQRQGSTLTVSGYQATGGIHRAIATTADRVYDRLDVEQQPLARTLLLRLVKIGDGTDDTRRRTDRTELLASTPDPVAAAVVLDEFVRSRLVFQERDTVEITHEALLRGWPRLRQWIDEDRAGLLVHQELEEAAAGWERGGRRDGGALYRGLRLATAQTWAGGGHSGDVSPAAEAFLATSTAQQRRSTRLRRGAIAAVTVLAVVATLTAVVAVQQRGAARRSDADDRRQRDAAIVNQVIAEAGRVRMTDASLAAQLDLVAYRMRPTPQLRTTVLNDQNVPLSQVLTGHTDEVLSVAFSPDGHTLATSGGNGDKTIRLWNMTDPTYPVALGPPLTGSSGAVNSVAFSPDGHTLASGGGDRTVRLWDVTDPAHPTALGAPLTGHTNTVTSVAFSPDGHTLASASTDRTVRLWNVTDPARPTALGPPLTGHTDYVLSVAFSPDSRTLASGGEDSTVRLWNVADPARARPLGQPLTGHAGAVLTVRFSPDGRTLASGSVDDTVRLWNVSDPAHPRFITKLTDHTNIVSSVAFSPDGSTLASGSYDGTVDLWNVSDPLEPRDLDRSLTGHVGGVQAVAFSPDGRTLASGGNDHTVRLWDLRRSSLPGPSESVNAAVFSPDARTLATGGFDGAVRFWNVADPTRPRALGSAAVGAGIVVYSVAFSSDGRTLAEAQNNGTIRLWNVSDPAHPAALGSLLTGNTKRIWAVEFSPNGQTLASVGDDGSVRLWNVEDPAHPTAIGVLASVPTLADFALSFSPDGRYLAAQGQTDADPLQLWNVADPAHPAPVGGPIPNAGTVDSSPVFSPDGRILAVAPLDNTVRLWDVSDPAHPAPIGSPLTGHTNGITSVVFSPHTHLLASAAFDRTVRLWDVGDPAHPVALGALTADADELTAVAFSPDGETLASAGIGGTIQLWSMNVTVAQAGICAATGPYLTRADWGRYVSTALPYSPPCH